MKVYRYIHASLLFISIIPMGLGLWPDGICIIPPLVVIAIYAVNEIVLIRREGERREAIASLQSDALLHAYRER